MRQDRPMCDKLPINAKNAVFVWYFLEANLVTSIIDLGALYDVVQERAYSLYCHIHDKTFKDLSYCDMDNIYHVRARFNDWLHA